MKKILRSRLLFLGVIVLLAFFLRIYKVTSIPPSLSWDEVSIGYNAYSILKTGYDEHHRFFPLDAFVAFGDYKPPLAIYATVPAVAIFGLNEFSVRLPSILAGTFAVLLTFFLVRELFKSFSFVSLLAYIASFLLAISPWHIQMSRAGFEANIAVALVILGVLLVLKSRENLKMLFVCWIPFVAAIYTFNSARYFVPLLAFALLIYCWRGFKAHTKKLVIGVFLSFILLLPILPHLLSPQARLRFTEVNIFSDLSIIETSNDRIAYDGNSIVGKIFHNRRVAFVRSYLNHFFDHLEPGFLFIRGDGNPKFSIQDVGQLYLVELPFLVLGIFWMFLKDKKSATLLLFWLIAAILPAATARETPHALRIENSLPIWQIFIAYGIVLSIKSQISRKRKMAAICIILVFYLANFSYYIHNYYSHYAKEYSGEWQYGYREAIRFIQPIKDQYQTIVMTESIGRPYAYVLFYEKYHPEQFWKTVDASFDGAGFYNVYGFDTYRFVKDFTESTTKTLYILRPSDVPNGARILQTIKLLNGDPILVIFDT